MKNEQNNFTLFDFFWWKIVQSLIDVLIDLFGN